MAWFAHLPEAAERGPAFAGWTLWVQARPAYRIRAESHFPLPGKASRLADMTEPPAFARFIAIDWSGAKNRASYRRKIQVASCRPGNEAPELVQRAGDWTRQGVADWLIDDVFPQGPALVGFDFSFAPPFVDAGAYLPGDRAPQSAQAFWGFVENSCTDADCGAASFIEQHYRPHFYLGKADGPKAPYMRLRRCEAHYNAAGGRKPSSIFDAIGAAQVSKASFAGMRVLHQLARHVPVWPFDPVQPGQSCVVEIYCQAFIRHAGLPGTKIRRMDQLDQALTGLGSACWTLAPGVPFPADDVTDVLVSAAGLRRIAGQARYWRPDCLTTTIARTEGWTFGVA